MNTETGTTPALIGKAGPQQCHSLFSDLKLSSTAVQAIKALRDVYPGPKAAENPGYGFVVKQPAFDQMGYPEPFNTYKSSGSRMWIVPKPKVPPRGKFRYWQHNLNLPIAAYKPAILDNIEGSRFSFIKGHPGSGKTTQVPQFLLEAANEKKKRVKIICVVPDRVSAITKAERVAEERGEPLGYTVGYQVRLESRISPCNTLLIYCTSSALMRSLAGPDYSVLLTTTHLILDELQERNSSMDYLLTCLRDILPLAGDLRIIFMGTTMDIKFFQKFMNIKNRLCSHITIQTTRPAATNCYLKTVKSLLNPSKDNATQKPDEMFAADVTSPPLTPEVEMELRKRRGLGPLAIDTGDSKYYPSSFSGTNGCTLLEKACREDGKDDNIRNRIDELILCALKTGDERVLYEFIDIILADESVKVDWAHSSTEATMLMAYSIHGNPGAVECLLNLGASWQAKNREGFTAEELARLFAQHEVGHLLEVCRKTMDVIPRNPLNLSSQGPPGITKTVDPTRPGGFLLSTVDHNRVDLPLVHSLLHFLHLRQSEKESILVIMSSYDDIISLKQMIFSNQILRFDSKPFVVHLLHAGVQCGDQTVIFSSGKPGLRKIVLADSISDYITLEGMTHVIDTGKIQETHVTPDGVTVRETSWISKRASLVRVRSHGFYKPDIVFRLYETQDYLNMEEEKQPEILTSDLQELCLHACSLVKMKKNIFQFFLNFPTPPPLMSIKRAVESLQKIGALDFSEQLTPLGSHLLDFHVEPRFAKALILAVIMRCLDPILTIIAGISHRDPFLIPSEPSEKQKAYECKQKFSMNSFSDHMCILKAFQKWELEKSENREETFCPNNYIGSGTFDMIYAIRTELLGQLRASGFVRCKGIGDVKNLNYNSSNWSVVKAVLVSAIYPNVMKLDPETASLSNEVIRNARFHPSSCVRPTAEKSLPARFVLYDEINECGSLRLVRGCTLVSSAAVALFGGNIMNGWNPCDVEVLQNDQLAFRLDKSIIFRGSKVDILMLMELRRKFRELVMRQIEKPGVSFTACEEVTMQTVVLVLTGEDHAAGLVQVEGVGRWPKFAGGNLLNTPRCGYEKPSESDSNSPTSPRERYQSMYESGNDPESPYTRAYMEYNGKNI